MRPATRFLATLRLVVGVSLVLALGACGQAAPAPATTPTPTSTGSTSAAPPAASPSAAPAAPKALVKATLRLPWLMTGYDGAFLVARDKGFYRDGGLDMTVGEGKSSVLTAESVAQGTDTFGFADASTVALLISQGAPLKVLADFVQSSPIGMIHSPNVSIDSPQDLKGKTIIANAAGGPQLQFLNPVLQKGGLTKQDVHLDLIDASALGSTFAAHQDRILLGFVNDTYPVVVKLAPTAVFTPYSKFGIGTLSLGLITNLTELQQHPDEVKAFVAASVKGWTYAMEHPDETVAAILKSYPNADKTVLANGLEQSIPLTHTPASQGKPVGWMAPQDWESTLKLLHDYSGMSVVKSPDTYYTNGYVPQ